MMRFGFGAQRMVLLGTSSSQDDKSLAGFEELAMPLFDSLYNFARWLVRNQSDAEDLVQETYRKALHSFASFQPGTNFRRRIFRILRNTFLSRSGLERKMTVAMESEEDGSEPAGERQTPETILIERSNRHLVQRAIDELGSTTGRSSFFVKWRKCPINRSPKYCRSRLEPSCHDSPGLDGQFASLSREVPRPTTYREACLITQAQERGLRCV